MSLISWSVCKAKASRKSTRVPTLIRFALILGRSFINDIQRSLHIGLQFGWRNNCTVRIRVRVMMELPRIVVDLVQLAYKVLSVTERALHRSVAYQDHYLTEQ